MNGAVVPPPRNDSIFRSEACRDDRNTFLGVIAVSPPRVGWNALGVAIAFIAGLIIVASVMTYTHRETVVGTLVPTRAAIEVLSDSRGLVKHLAVSEGTSVVAGDLIAEISTDVLTEHGASRASILSAIATKRRTLVSDAETEAKLTSAGQSSLRTQITDIKTKIDNLEDQISLQEQRAKSAQALYERWVSVGETGVISTQQLLQQKDTALQSAGDVKRLQGQRIDAMADLEKLKTALDNLQDSASLKTSERQRLEAQFATEEAEADAARAIIIRAPVSGVVSGVMKQEGEAVAIGMILATILPVDARYRAQLWLPNNSAGLVHAGQGVRIRYDSFPYQRFGIYTGRVAEVTQAAIPLAAQPQVGSEETRPSYRVLVDLNQQQIAGVDTAQSLRSGMSLTADILLEQRPLYDWLFGIGKQPIQRARGIAL